MLTKERCDECIEVSPDGLWWKPTTIILGRSTDATPDEAELFAYRLLDAVKRAREMQENE